ncbi:MAG: aminoacetone oxidase family FAD-binding enzyme [Bacteroidales bacterium]|nr:aminoacetone oxidase family FAD-binding enzyme [Bacteroidales bacterium]
MTQADVIVIGAGAAGLASAHTAASQGANVILLEKMPKVGRKIMITGKGRCNLTNLKDWNAFSGYIASNAKFPKNAFMSFTPATLKDWFESEGMETILERGDRVFPASGSAASVVDTLVKACQKSGVEIITGAEVSATSCCGDGFKIETTSGEEYSCLKLIIATGGLSYPATGSTGDGYAFAKSMGHKITQTFPSLTALVPRGYKMRTLKPESKCHISRSEAMTAFGQALCGNDLENVQLSLFVDGVEADSQFGDLSFTDGGLEGAIGFKVSRKAVKSLINGSKVSVSIDLKPSVTQEKLTGRIVSLFEDGSKPEKVLSALIPRNLIKPFIMSTGLDHFTPERLSRTLKSWTLPIEGYVGYERAVVTAGGICLDEVFSKTLESRLVKNLYFAGEVLDIDAHTGGFNLQLAFCTGHLAGLSAAKSL